MTDVVPRPKAGVKRGRDLYRKARRQVLDRSRGYCEAKIPDVCKGWGEHFHHIRRRSQGGSDVASNLAHLCEPCHTYVHGHPLWAQEQGLLSVGQLEPNSTAVLSVTLRPPRCLP